MKPCSHVFVPGATGPAAQQSCAADYRIAGPALGHRGRIYT